MPRNVSDVYSLPGGSIISNGDTSDASDINAPLADIVSDLNLPRPIVAGGTGESSLAAAQNAFKIPAFDGTPDISGDWTVSGSWLFTASPTFNDSVKLNIGSGPDGYLYHSGANAYLRCDTGILYVEGDTIVLRNAAQNKAYLTGVSGGAVNLRYDDSTKLATVSGGVVIVGDLDADTFSGDGVSSDISADTGSTTKLPTVDAVEAAIAANSPFTDSFVSSEQTITSAGLLQLAHGLSSAPSLVQFQLVCKTAEGGWSIGDKPFVDMASPHSTGDIYNTAWPDATNVNVRFSNAASCFRLGHKTTGVMVNLTNANWKLVVRAWV